MELTDAMGMEHLSVPVIGADVILLCGLFLLFLKAGRTSYTRLEGALSRFAERGFLASCTLFFGVIALRVALLPLLPVPVPGIHDEFVYLLQGDTFAHGRLTNPPHPLWVSFETFHVNWLPTYCSKFPPAQGVVLALGEILGQPWIGVLLSVAAMCVAVFWMLRGWMPARWAFLGAAITALKFGFTSYWINSYWGGAVAAIGGALVLGGIGRIRRRASARDAFLVGAGMAILANSRPYEGMLFCIPAGIWLILWVVGRLKTRDSWRVRWRNVAVPVALVLALTAAFTGYYNWRLTGNALLLPYQLNTRTYLTAPSFLWQQPGAVLHFRNTAFQVFYNGVVRSEYHSTWYDAKRVSKDKLDHYTETFFWPGAGFALLGVPFFFRDRKMRLTIATLIFGAVAVFSVVWSNPHYGAPLTCVLYALLVQAIRHLRTMRVSDLRFGVGLSRALVLLLVLNTATHVITRTNEPAFLPSEGLLERAQTLAQLERLPGKHLVIVRYAKLRNPHREWVFNGADIDGGKVIWAREMDAEQNAKLVAYFRDRQIWILEPDRNTPLLTPYTPPAEMAKQ